jgi:S-adenosylmethionine uptake transporter
MAALWMVLAALLFSTMGVAVKYASASFSSAELVFYRGLIGLLFMAVATRAQGVTLRTPVPAMHAWRSLVGVLSLGGWFYAIAHLPLATATTLNYMSSVWIGAFILGSALLYGQALRQGPLLATVLGGFAGVLLMLQPTLEPDQLFAGLIGLMSGVTAGLAYMQVTALGRAGEPASRTVFYFALASTLAGALATLAGGWSAWTWPAVAWLLPIGVLASLGQWCMTRAYSEGATLVVANLQYSGVIFASAFGVLLFDDRIAWQGWLGMALIVGSGIAATVLRARAMPDAPAEEH